MVSMALLAWAGLALADLGCYAPLSAFAVAVAGCAAILALAWRARSRPASPSTRRAGDDRRAGAGRRAAVLPRLPVRHGRQGPGVYVGARHHDRPAGSYALDDPTLDRSRIPSVAGSSPGARFPGIWIKDATAQRIVPQFYHLWPALLASAFRLV
jgi:hypothetical protein